MGRLGDSSTLCFPRGTCTQGLRRRPCASGDASRGPSAGKAHMASTQGGRARGAHGVSLVLFLPLPYRCELFKIKHLGKRAEAEKAAQAPALQDPTPGQVREDLVGLKKHHREQGRGGVSRDNLLRGRISVDRPPPSPRKDPEPWDPNTLSASGEEGPPGGRAHGRLSTTPRGPHTPSSSHMNGRKVTSPFRFLLKSMHRRLSFFFFIF